MWLQHSWSLILPFLPPGILEGWTGQRPGNETMEN